jgi:membrane protein implicated in regulation of membrane protease activity
MAQQTKKRKTDLTLPFGKKNLQILSIGLIMIVLGFIAMAQPPVNSFWSLTLAPIVLLLAYLLVVPYAIMYGYKLFARADSGQQEEAESQKAESRKPKAGQKE